MEAERKATQIISHAQERLAAANAEVEQTEAEARHGVEVLQGEVRRHEERLESIFVVFQGMTSQLEEFLGQRAEQGAIAETSDEELDNVLRPEPSSTRVP